MRRRHRTRDNECTNANEGDSIGKMGVLGHTVDTKRKGWGGGAPTPLGLTLECFGCLKVCRAEEGRRRTMYSGKGTYHICLFIPVPLEFMSMLSQEGKKEEKGGLEGGIIWSKIGLNE